MTAMACRNRHRELESKPDITQKPLAYGPRCLNMGVDGVAIKIEEVGFRRFWSMFPLTRVPCWYRFFEPQPYVHKLGGGGGGQGSAVGPCLSIASPFGPPGDQGMHDTLPPTNMTPGGHLEDQFLLEGNPCQVPC